MAKSPQIWPQPGPQLEFLVNPCDIVIYGGAAGGGKTFALLMQPLRHVKDPKFRCVTFRRTSPMIRKAGAIWDESQDLYRGSEGKPREQMLDWRFPSGAEIQFSHLQRESDKYGFKGAQISLVQFDQLEEFTETQFFYIISRLRTEARVLPYCRATCNPDSESWLAQFLEWWIDQDTGLIIKDRIGVPRHMTRPDDQIMWHDEPQYDEDGQKVSKSVTFIEADLDDNKLMPNRQEYKASLLAQPLVERERLLNKNWKIAVGKGKVFKREDFKIVPRFPANARFVRTWDFAATEKKTKGDDPDFTATCKIAEVDGVVYMQFERDQLGPAQAEAWFLRLAKEEDGVPIVWEMEPGAAAIRYAHYLQGLLSDMGRTGMPQRPQGDKVTRASAGYSKAVEDGKVYLVSGVTPIDHVLSEHHNFPTQGWKDDLVDAGSLAYLNKARAGAARTRQVSWT